MTKTFSDIRNLFQLKHWLIITFITLVSACNQSDDGQKSASAADTTHSGTVRQGFTVSDGFEVIAPGRTQYVELSKYSSKTSSIQVNSVTTEDPDCQDATVKDHGFEVSVRSNPSLCRYTYSASSLDASASAEVIVFASNALQPTLPPISRALQVDGNAVDIDLKQLLATDFPAGYQLVDQAALNVQGDNKGAVVYKSGTTFSYKPPTMSGWNRIVYTLSHPSKTDQDKVGAVYVTISDKVNLPPQIGKPNLDYKTEVDAGVSLTIDLKTSGATITEPDGQGYQLLAVQSMTGVVQPTDKDSVTNTQFTFKAQKAGEHIVSYIVADHYGGYSMGQMKITVNADLRPRTWEQIAIGSEFFTAPERYIQSVFNVFHVAPEWDTGVKNTLSAFNDQSGQQYCASRGRLPTVSEMQSLHVEENRLDKKKKWPKDKHYLTQTNNNGNIVFAGYDLKANTVSKNLGPYYVTCVQNSSFGLRMRTNIAVADGKEHWIATLTKKDISQSPTLTVKRGSLDDAEVTLSSKSDPNDSLKIRIFVRGTKAGSFYIDASDSSDSVKSPLVTLIGDASNVNSLEIKPGAVSSAIANGTDKIKATYILTDKNNNPISGHAVTFTWSGNALDGITTSQPIVRQLTGGTVSMTGTTNQNGEVVIEASANAANDNLVIIASVSKARSNVWQPRFIQKGVIKFALDSFGYGTALSSDGTVDVVWAQQSLGGTVPPAILKVRGYQNITNLVGSGAGFGIITNNNNNNTAYTFAPHHPHLNNLKGVQDVDELIGSSESWLAIKPDRSVEVWGKSSGKTMSCGIDTSTIRVKKVKAVTNGFVILLENGEVFVCGKVWGLYDPYPTPRAHYIVDIMGTETHVLLIHVSGRTQQLGPLYRYPSRKTPHPTTLDIKKMDKVLYSTGLAFAVLWNNGTVTNWGLNSYGGATTASMWLKDIDKIVPTYRKFGALNRKTNTLTIWGGRYNPSTHSEEEVPTETLSGVKDVVSSIGGGFFIRKTDGSSIIWGDDSHSYIPNNMLKDVKKILKNSCYGNTALAALKFDGTVEVFGEARCGGNNNTGVDLTGGVKDIYSSGHSFHAIKNDGRLVSWGYGFKPRPN
ncbi:hypothetical protein BTO10_05260 [Vibrio chagasii]|uniref:Big-1 domain-containing protein n=1 Tax=Vibrio chagasii TaxID=170679 RepID=A0A2S7VQ03_9VIBR|nr:Ig-like domain-containing protein [Vibrio chagasii]PQJ64199.1 hypothetical protein BTO10_05260 [Vibrio chagasii]